MEAREMIGESIGPHIEWCQPQRR